VVPHPSFPQLDTNLYLLPVKHNICGVQNQTALRLSCDWLFGFSLPHLRQHIPPMLAWARIVAISRYFLEEHRRQPHLPRNVPKPSPPPPDVSKSAISLGSPRPYVPWCTPPFVANELEIILGLRVLSFFYLSPNWTPSSPFSPDPLPHPAGPVFFLRRRPFGTTSRRTSGTLPCSSIMYDLPCLLLWALSARPSFLLIYTYLDPLTGTHPPPSWDCFFFPPP